MRLSVEFFARIMGAIICAVSFGYYGEQIASFIPGSNPRFVITLLGLLGALIGLLITPSLTVRPFEHLRRSLVVMSPERLFAIVIGIFMGLLATSLVSPILSLLPSPFEVILPLGAAFVFCYSAVVILTSRQNDLRALLSNVSPFFQTGSGPSRRQDADGVNDDNPVLLDTSVIIDGRIVDIVKTGFVRNPILVPSFILLELQHIADSEDTMRRNRGRRGLEVLNILQKDSPIPVKITDMDVSEVREADSKLIALARHLHAPIMTNDYNLNRVAELQGILVLNVNELANAIKAIFLPGESLSVKIIQEGKEDGQGVGFLEDGTMVVVDQGREFLNDMLNITVTKVLQTTAGRMIFARPTNP